MRGFLRAGGLAVLAGLAFLPAASASGSGWQIRHFESGNGYSVTGTATRCSRSKYGRYSYRGDGTFSSGSRTETMHETGWIELLSNHRLGRVHISTLSGSAFNGYKPSFKRKIKSEINHRSKVKVISLVRDQITIQGYYRGQSSGRPRTYTLHSVRC